MPRMCMCSQCIKQGNRERTIAFFVLESSQTLKATATTLLQKTAMKINNGNTSLKEKEVIHSPLLF